MSAGPSALLLSLAAEGRSEEGSHARIVCPPCHLQISPQLAEARGAGAGQGLLLLAFHRRGGGADASAGGEEERAHGPHLSERLRPHTAPAGGLDSRTVHAGAQTHYTCSRILPLRSLRRRRRRPQACLTPACLALSFSLSLPQAPVSIEDSQMERPKVLGMEERKEYMLTYCLRLQCVRAAVRAVE